MGAKENMLKYAGLDRGGNYIFENEVFGRLVEENNANANKIPENTISKNAVR